MRLERDYRPGEWHSTHTHSREKNRLPKKHMTMYFQSELESRELRAEEMK